MSRSAAARAAEEAAARAQAKPARRTKMSSCPLCSNDIYTNQHTAWRYVGGTLARVHGTCLEPPVTRRKVQD